MNSSPDFFKLRNSGHSPTYHQNLLRTVQSARKNGAQLLKIISDESVVEAFLLEDMGMKTFHSLSQAVNRTKKAELFDQFGAKRGSIEQHVFQQSDEPNIESPTQQYVEKQAKAK